ncbi:MAG TPA: LysR family transcriptional regulator [Candidatus Ventrimonas merdavium]|nr:LysR family transcriptional regulator [Candidatus Ventrimonas merdavium]
MDVKAMEYILAIAKETSLSGAAKRAGISQPAMSVFLSRLETELGTDLFYREKKKLTLTPAGRIYADAAEKILDVKSQTYQTIYRLTHTQRESIIVGATPLRGSIMVAQIFSQFNSRFPDIKLEIREGYMHELNRLVAEGSVTYALGSCYDTENPALDYIVISKEEVLVGVPSFHPLAARGLAVDGYPEKLAAIQISELADSPFVLLSAGTTIRTITDNIFSKEGIVPTVVFETSNNLVLSNMIQKGAGVGLLPRSAMVKDTDDIVYFSLSPRYYLNLAIMLQKHRRLSAAERYLAYLVIRQDCNNPLYIPALNAFARSLRDEFSGEEDTN